METLIELQNRIYNQNKELGWHDEPRSFSTFACLFHSELSEAMEGLRKCLADDHLPQYSMFQVEMADFVIRCLDWLGSVNYSEHEFAFEFKINDVMCNIDMLAWLHHSVSMALDCDHFHDTRKNYISSAVNGCFEYAECKGWPLMQIINEKIEYNKHRVDHKRENREKAGGKKF